MVCLYYTSIRHTSTGSHWSRCHAELYHDQHSVGNEQYPIAGRILFADPEDILWFYHTDSPCGFTVIDLPSYFCGFAQVKQPLLCLGCLCNEAFGVSCSGDCLPLSAFVIFWHLCWGYTWGLRLFVTPFTRERYLSEPLKNCMAFIGLKLY